MAVIHTIGTPWCFATTAEAAEAIASFDGGMTNKALAFLASKGWSGLGLHYEIRMAHMLNPDAGRHVWVSDANNAGFGYLRQEEI